MSNNQSPYMLETASNYLRGARVLWGQPNLSGVAVVNAALAIEIILKSFLATATENNRKGGVSEQYEIIGKRIHKLTELAKLIDSELYENLGFVKHEECFKKYNNFFVESRYPYETDSSGGCSEAPIKVGIEMFRATINWYKETGNHDPWVAMYPEVAGGGI